MKSRDHYKVPLQQALAHSLSYLGGLDERPVGATDSLAELRARVDQALPDAGLSSEKVVDELVKRVGNGLNDSAGGRFFAWVIGGGLPAALAADWLTSAWDQNAGMYSVAPAAAVVEETVGRWLKELLGLPSAASFALVTGCQMAHVTALAAARNHVLHRVGWDVEEKGLMGAPEIRVISGDQRHGTIERALRLLGLGRRCVVDLPVNGSGQVEAQVLRQELEQSPQVPTIVLLQAGDINTGAYDNFRELIPLAHEFEAWVHVDGAFGLWAGASSDFSHLLEGVDAADSWATDGHKWLNVPYDCGYAFVAHRDPHLRSFSHLASYLNHSTEVRDQVDWNPEYSRRARGFATYAALLALGKQGVGELVGRCCNYAKRIVVEAGEIPGVSVLAQPVINQGLLRFKSPETGASESDHDRFTEDVVGRVVSSGEAFFACTTYQGKRCMRVSVCNWQTDDQAVDRAVAAIRSAVSAS